MEATSQKAMALRIENGRLTPSRIVIAVDWDIVLMLAIAVSSPYQRIGSSVVTTMTPL